MAVVGIDLSKYQLIDGSPPGAFGWQSAYEAGARFVIIRATRTNLDGSVYKDIRLDDYVQSRRFVQLAGFYAYVRLNYDPLKQAEAFLSAIQNYSSARAVIDLEGERPGGLSPSQAASRLQIWLDRVEAVTNRTPMIYTRQSWFDFYIAPSTAWQRYPLWLARYPGIDSNYQPLLQGPYADGRFKPRDWPNWTFWQYTDSGPGFLFGAESREIDLNYFNGTPQELADFIGEVEGPGEPPPPPEGFAFQVDVDLLNVRSGPSVSYPVVDLLKRGDRVVASDVDGLHAWVEISPGRWTCVTLNGRRFMSPVDR
jgi:lysozyme